MTTAMIAMNSSSEFGCWFAMGLIEFVRNMVGRLLWHIGCGEENGDTKGGAKSVDIVSTGIYANPNLRNYYHVPNRTKESFSFRDNNIVYADENIVVMETPWVQGDTQDVYRLSFMICTKA